MRAKHFFIPFPKLQITAIIFLCMRMNNSCCTWNFFPCWNALSHSHFFSSLSTISSSYGWNVFAMCRWMLSHIVCVFYSRSKGIFERCLLAADCVLVRLRRRRRQWNKGESREGKLRKFLLRCSPPLEGKKKVIKLLICCRFQEHIAPGWKFWHDLEGNSNPSDTCMHTHPTNNKNFKGNLFPKRKTNFETCHTQHFSKLTNETSKKTEFWNNFSREKAKRKKKKTRENITHQQQKQQISVEISISFPSTQIALHKRKAEIKCLFLIVSLCFLLHFLLLGDFFCCHYFTLRLLSSLLMDMLFLMCLKQT